MEFHALYMWFPPHLASLEWSRLTLLRLTDFLAYLSFAFLLGIFVRQYQARKKLLPLPPGPSKTMLEGAARHKGFEYLGYEQWAKELDSDIIHFEVGGRSFVVLSSWDAISEIFDKQASIYSDRAQDTMKAKVVGWDWPLSSLPFGDRWKQSRALFQKHLHPFNRKLFRPRQLEFIRGQLLPQLLEGPTNVIPVVRHFTGGLSFSLAYGIEIQRKNDPFVEQAERAMASVVQLAIPGRWLVNKYPILRFVPSWFPGAEWKRQAKVWRRLQVNTRTKAFDAAMQGISKGTIKPSFLEECIRVAGDNTPDHAQMELIKDVAAIIFGAGADTTASTINTFIVAMLCYPETQKKAQAELDRVLGPNRLPTFEDREQLPYVTAIMKEGLRWQNSTPLAVPHMSSEEGEYKGYRIPMGAQVFGNVWALMHDEKEFPNPMEFLPERFLNPDGSLNDSVRDPATAVFGFGRRMCPGRHIALSALWMSIASILTAFRIDKGIDDDGNLIEPEPKFLPGFARLAAPFRATFTVRSKEMESIIQAAELQL